MHQLAIPLALSVSFLWALYPLILKSVQHIDPLIIYTIMYSISTILAIGLCIIKKKPLKAFMLPTKCLLPIATAALIGTFIASLIYTRLITHAGNKVSVVIALAYTSPVIAAILGYYFFNEQLTIKSVIGIIVTVCGILLLVT